MLRGYGHKSAKNQLFVRMLDNHTIWTHYLIHSTPTALQHRFYDNFVSYQDDWFSGRTQLARIEQVTDFWPSTTLLAEWSPPPSVLWIIKKFLPPAAQIHYTKKSPCGCSLATLVVAWSNTSRICAECCQHLTAQANTRGFVLMRTIFSTLSDALLSNDDATITTEMYLMLNENCLYQKRVHILGFSKTSGSIANFIFETVTSTCTAICELGCMLGNLNKSLMWITFSRTGLCSRTAKVYHTGTTNFFHHGTSRKRWYVLTCLVKTCQTMDWKNLGFQQFETTLNYTQIDNSIGYGADWLFQNCC